MLSNIETAKSIAMTDLQGWLSVEFVAEPGSDFRIYGFEFDPERHWLFHVYDPNQPGIGSTNFVVVDRITQEVVSRGQCGE